MNAFRISKKEINQPSIGEMFRRTRINKRLGFEEVEAATKIRIKYLEAIEGEKWRDLPSGPYVSGFLKNYAFFLGLPFRKIEGLYKREITTKEFLNKNNRIIPRKELRYPRVFITPTILATAFLVVVVAGVISYIIYQILGFASAPYLIINSPVNGTTAASPSLIVEGKTQEGASLYINGQLLGIDTEGNFKQEVKLKEGSNSINITAINKGGKKAEKNLIILYQLRSELQFSKEMSQ